MEKIAIYGLTSELHNEAIIRQTTKEFLDSLGITFDFKGNDFSDYGCHMLDLIFVQTGGTEGIFKRLLPTLISSSLTSKPIYLLTSGKSNSLAASMEILAYLRQHGLNGEILHGDISYIARRISLLVKVNEARRRVAGMRLGVIGQPSDWLIASNADYAVVRQKLGVEIVDISMQELLDRIPIDKMPVSTQEGALCIYEALLSIVRENRLNGFTLRCFDLLTAVHNTGCLALARLNAEGIVAGCEGDIPAMLSMLITQALTSFSGFQANPASVNPETGEVLFAHCTIPLNMVERYELDTHFESGIGIGIRGYMPLGPVTIFKIAGDMNRYFVCEGQLEQNLSKPNLCRTQQLIRLADPAKAAYFLNDPIGNHHIVIPVHCRSLLENFMK